MIWLITFLSIGNGIAEFLYLFQEVLTQDEKTITIFILIFQLMIGGFVVCLLKFIRNTSKLNLKAKYFSINASLLVFLWSIIIIYNNF